GFGLLVDRADTKCRIDDVDAKWRVLEECRERFFVAALEDLGGSPIRDVVGDDEPGIDTSGPIAQRNAARKVRPSVRLIFDRERAASESSPVKWLESPGKRRVEDVEDRLADQRLRGQPCGVDGIAFRDEVSEVVIDDKGGTTRYARRRGSLDQRIEIC